MLVIVQQRDCFEVLLAEKINNSFFPGSTRLMCKNQKFLDLGGDDIGNSNTSTRWAPFSDPYKWSDMGPL